MKEGPPPADGGGGEAETRATGGGVPEGKGSAHARAAMRDTREADEASPCGC